MIHPKPIRPSFVYYIHGMEKDLEQILHHEKG